MRVLVTGGAGFIGSHVVDRLIAHGHDARIFDLERPRYPEHEDVDIVIGDVLDRGALLGAARGCEAIAHLATSADVGVVAAQPLAVGEATPLAHPSHLYSATKLAGEMYCHTYSQLHDDASTNLRFGIPHRPRARPAAVLPIFVLKALAGGPRLGRRAATELDWRASTRFIDGVRRYASWRMLEAEAVEVT